MKKIVLIAVSIVIFSGSVFAGVKQMQKNYSGRVVDPQRATQDASWTDSENSAAESSSNSSESHDIEV